MGKDEDREREKGGKNLEALFQEKGHEIFYSLFSC